MNWTPDERFVQSDSQVFVFGAARSGKTTVAKLASSFAGVNHVDEYWPLLAISIAANGKEISTDAFSSIARCMMAELQNDSALLRFGNFRPRDASSIFKYKSKREILERLIKLKSRSESAQYVKEKKYKLWLTCTDLNICEDLFQNTFQTSPRVLILRHPTKVSYEISKKKWFANQTLLRPTSNTPTVKFYSKALKLNLFLPWWLPRNEHDSWVNSDEITRGLIYWKIMHNNYLIDSQRLSRFALVIAWDELFQQPNQVIQKLENLLQKKMTNKPNKLIRSLKDDNNIKIALSPTAENILRDLQPLITKFNLSVN